MLSEEQIKFYDDNGYLVVRNVFYYVEREAMRREANKVTSEDYKVYLNIHRDVVLFKNVVTTTRLVEMVKQVARSKVVCTNDQYLYKKAGTPYARQSWSPHQDATYVNAPYGTYMQAFIFLDKHMPGNGGTYCYPGSHKEPMLPYTYVESWAEGFDSEGISHPGWTVKVPQQYPKVDIIGWPGDVMLQHGNLIHGSYPNNSDIDRAQYSIAYLNEGTEIHEGKVSVKIPVAVE